MRTTVTAVPIPHFYVQMLAILVVQQSTLLSVEWMGQPIPAFVTPSSAYQVDQRDVVLPRYNVKENVPVVLMSSLQFVELMVSHIRTLVVPDSEVSRLCVQDNVRVMLMFMSVIECVLDFVLLFVRLQ